jgi:methyltransferase
MIWFTLLILLTGVERIWELVLSNRNARWALARGGREFGQRHYPYMVVLHTGFLLGCIAEVYLGDRPFIPWLGWPMLVIAIACQGLRYWCIGVLGRQWNSRVIVVPGLGRVTRGPYRFLPHPNYLVVIAEGIALPLVHTAWVTAIVFTVLNAILLFGFRIPTEERALRALDAPAPLDRHDV